MAALTALLSGCVANPTDSVPAGDTQVDTSGGHGEAVELPELPTCPGADFTSSLPWYPASPWWFLRSVESDMYGTWAALEQAAAATGCPAASTEGDATTLSGDCAAADVEFEGTWRAESVSTGGVLDFTLDAMTAVVTLDDTPQDLAASGTFYWERTVVDGEPLAEYERSEGTRSLHRGSALDGDFAFEGLEVTQDTTQFVASGAVAVDWAYGSGRYCPVVELHAAPDCPEEPDGYYAIQGAATWLMVADGSGACDGCVDVYQDGVWQEQFCDLPALFY